MLFLSIYSTVYLGIAPDEVLIANLSIYHKDGKLIWIWIPKILKYYFSIMRRTQAVKLKKKTEFIDELKNDN